MIDRFVFVFVFFYFALTQSGRVGIGMCCDSHYAKFAIRVDNNIFIAHCLHEEKLIAFSIHFASKLIIEYIRMHRHYYLCVKFLISLVCIQRKKRLETMLVRSLAHALTTLIINVRIIFYQLVWLTILLMFLVQNVNKF